MKTLIGSLFIASSIFLSASCLADDEWTDIKDRLNPAVPDLVSLPAKTELEVKPFIRGKLVVVESGGFGWFLNDIYYDELKEVYAHKPEEIGTVALINCTKTRAGVYTSNQDASKEIAAYRSSCELSMIDRSQQAIVFVKTFSALIKEEARGQGNYVFAGVETQFEIRSFLKQLPRK